MDSNLGSRLFIIGMWWRIGYGFLRILFGLALLKVVGDPLIDVLKNLMSYELLENPSDILYSFVTHTLTVHPLYVSYFLAFYFIFWGVVDMVLSYHLIKHRLWAFPVSFVLIGGFILYEIIRFTHTHSYILLGIIILDSFILWLIWREYQKMKSKKTSILS